MFSNRRAWFEHEFKQHLAERMWMCGVCSARTATKEAFLQHIERNHPEYTYVEGQIAAKTSKSVGWQMKSPVFCPLCERSLEPSPNMYAKHVGRHLEQIALVALRIHNFNETPEEDDDEFPASQSSDSRTDDDPSVDAHHDKESELPENDENANPAQTQS